MSSERTQRAHREMYKARTPPWKETYRKRCLERLKDSREKLKDRFRNLQVKDVSDSPENDSFIEELMKDELKCLQKEHMSTGGDDLDLEVDGSLNIDEILTLFEDIQDELRKEGNEDRHKSLDVLENGQELMIHCRETRIETRAQMSSKIKLRMLEEFAKYEHSLQEEERQLSSVIDKLTSEEVICPMCQKNPLHINMSVIFCKCGLRINTEQDCLTLSNVQQMLEHGVQDHSKNCDYKPCFTVMSELGTSNLLMACQECDWMSVII